MPTIFVVAIVLFGTSCIVGLLLFLGLAQVGRLAVTLARKFKPEPPHAPQFDWMEGISRQAAFLIAAAFTGALWAVLVLIVFLRM